MRPISKPNDDLDRKAFCKHDIIWDLIALAIIAAAIFLFFFNYTHFLQQTDTYAKWFYSLSTYRGQYIENARYGEWIYMWFFYKVMGEPQHFRAFHVFVGMVLDIAIVFILWKIISKKRSVDPSWIFRAITLLIAIALRANVFYSDIYQFGVDTAPMFIGDLLAIIAGWIIAERSGWLSCMAGILPLCASLFFRQTCLFWFIFTGLIIVYRDADTYEKLSFLVKKILKMIGCIIIAVIPVLICINLISPAGSRGSLSNMDLAASWRSFRETFTSLLRDCDGVQPAWFYSVLLLVTMCIFIILVIVRKKGSKERLFVFAKYIIITAGVFMGTFFAVIFETYLPHRTTYGFATILPLWILLIVYDLFDGKRSRWKYICIFLTCMLILNFSVNYVYTRIFYNGMVETNRVDQDNARYYYEKILEYENETGITVNNLAWHYDRWFTWNIPGVKGSKALNNRAYGARWSRREIFPFTVGRRFKIVEYDEDIYQAHYGDANWDELSDEQIMFIGDTVYIVLY